MWFHTDEHRIDNVSSQHLSNDERVHSDHSSWNVNDLFKEKVVYPSLCFIGCNLYRSILSWSKFNLVSWYRVKFRWVIKRGTRYHHDLNSLGICRVLIHNRRKTSRWLYIRSIENCRTWRNVGDNLLDYSITYFLANILLKCKSMSLHKTFLYYNGLWVICWELQTDIRKHLYLLLNCCI